MFWFEELILEEEFELLSSFTQFVEAAEKWEIWTLILFLIFVCGISRSLDKKSVPPLNYLAVIYNLCLTVMVHGAVMGSEAALLAVNVCVC